jgi:anti-sigma regulatory factor (Ser/Thr protein kinase)
MARARPSGFPSADGFSLVLALGFRAGDVAAVRRRVDRELRDRGLAQEEADDFVVAINEIMTNAVRHGGGFGRLRLWVGGEFVCEIEDHGGGFAAGPYLIRVERPSATPSGGMGLWIAQQTTDGLPSTVNPPVQRFG